MTRYRSRSLFSASAFVRKVGLIIIVALSSVEAPSTWAGINEWTSVGWLSGGWVQLLIVDSKNPDTIFAIGSGAGVFKSGDGGTNWRPVNFGLPITNVSSLVISPQKTSVLFAGTSGRGVFKSTDGGESWGPAGLMGKGISQLAIDPLDYKIVYAATYGTPFETAAMYKTTDGGVSWTLLATGGFGKQVLTVDPHNSGTIYAGEGGISNGGLHKSTDGGLSWTEAPAMRGCLMTALIIPQQDPNLAYASASCFAVLNDDDILAASVFKSTDGGSTWTAVNSGLPDTASITTLAVDPQSPTMLYAGTAREGIFKSTDGGASWRESDPPLNLTWVNTLAIDPVNPNRMYAGTSVGALKSVNGGRSWSSVGPGLGAIGVSALAIDASEPATLYASAQLPGSPGRVFKSADGGLTWSLVNPVGNNVVVGLAVNPQDHSIYAITGEALFKSIDSGSSWTTKSGRPGEGQLIALALDPLDPNTVYAGTASRGIFKSTDGGTSWRDVNSGISAATPFVFTVLSLAVAPTAPGTIYASTSLGLFKSTDAATTWNRLNSVPTDINIYALLVAPSIPETVYAATNSGLIKSTDGGASWTSANFGMGENAFRALALDSRNPNTLFAGTPRGLFTITFASEHPLVESIEFDRASVAIGDSFVARASGTDLTAQTYFDIRYRAPGGSAELEALNWQTGSAAVHGISAGTTLGVWTVTGVRAHADQADHTSTYRPTSASITVLAILGDD